MTEDAAALMRTLKPARAPDGVPSLTSPPSRLDRAALFLDLDGVLAPLARRPEDVMPETRRTTLLRRLEMRFEGRIAVISGRTTAEIDRITDRSVASVSGVHGLELRRAGGRLERADPHPAMPRALSELEAYAADRPGMIIEDKLVSATLHYRQAPGFAADALNLARDLARQTGLAFQPGDHVVELKTPGSTKGSALDAFMAEAPFAGSFPVMIGDDLTDEDGFRAALAHGGFGVLVGQNRATAARYRLDDVEAVLTWLEHLSDSAA